MNYLVAGGGGFNEYPAILKEERKEGKVIVSFQVNSSCVCTKFKAVSYTDPLFQKSALKALKKITKKWPLYLDVKWP